MPELCAPAVCPLVVGGWSKGAGGAMCDGARSISCGGVWGAVRAGLVSCGANALGALSTWRAGSLLGVGSGRTTGGAIRSTGRKASTRCCGGGEGGFGGSLGLCWPAATALIAAPSASVHMIRSKLMVLFILFAVVPKEAAPHCVLSRFNVLG